MGKKKHNFREFFHLVDPENPKVNKKAVCLSCVRKYTLPVALTKPECFVSNKAKLCRGHLRNCENFKADYNEDEVLEILLRPIPEDARKKAKVTKNDFKSEDESFETSAPTSSSTNQPALKMTKQETLAYYVARPLSEKDRLHFENLVLRMIISNGLPFTFTENQETKETEAALKLQSFHPQELDQPALLEVDSHGNDLHQKIQTKHS
ncbi:3003_t:CDS:2, partial [Ambispora leptoticha]